MTEQQKLSARQVFMAFLKLGLASFGGPVAHLGYFRHEFVTRRRCLQESAYADLVALCQFLPGPASSQVGIGIGLSQAGFRGALAAWIGFTLPSAIALILFAYGIIAVNSSVVEVGWLHGLKVMAVAVVAQAILGMGKSLCPDWPRKILAVGAALVALYGAGVWGQLAAISGGALIGLFFFRAEKDVVHQPALFSVSRKRAVFSLGLFLALLLLLPLLATQGGWLFAVADSFYRSGALVFGGGHVVLPLLQAEVVNPGWISKDLFVAGYGAAQAVPGPLFTFSAYLGTVLFSSWIGGLLCLVSIFLPSFLLLSGIVPFWESVRKISRVRSALVGVNAAVVGLLLAAFYDPVWSSAIRSGGDLALALVAFGLLVWWKLPPWLVVGTTGFGGALVGFLW